MRVYLSGEIHSDRRREVEDGARAAALAVVQTPRQLGRCPAP